MAQALKKFAEQFFPGMMYTLRVRRWAKAEREIRFLRALCRSDGVALDIGANRGGYTWHLLPLVRRVTAFEPLPQMQAILRSVYGNKIHLEGVILSDREGNGELRYPVGDYERATVAESNSLTGTIGHIETAVVPMKTLDSYQFNDICFVKIDVEGHEEAVLRGGRETLRRERPNLLIEIEERHSPGSLYRVSALLQEIGYSGHYLDGDRICEISQFDPARDQSPDHVSESGRTGRYINNFLFLQQEQAGKIIERAHSLL